MDADDFPLATLAPPFPVPDPPPLAPPAAASAAPALLCATAVVLTPVIVVVEEGLIKVDVMHVFDGEFAISNESAVALMPRASKANMAASATRQRRIAVKNCIPV